MYAKNRVPIALRSVGRFVVVLSLFVISYFAFLLNNPDLGNTIPYNKYHLNDKDTKM